MTFMTGRQRVLRSFIDEGVHKLFAIEVILSNIPERFDVLGHLPN